MTRKKVLIIQHGYCTGADGADRWEIDYSDILRSTSLLEGWKDRYVCWITRPEVRDLLRDNHLIDKLVLADMPHHLPVWLQEPNFDTVLNLDKRREWCGYSACVQAKEYFGIQYADSAGQNRLYEASRQGLLKLLWNPYGHSHQDYIFGLTGRRWQGQRLGLGYQPRVIPIYDVGLNYFDVGREDGNRNWQQNHWEQLYIELSAASGVSWQPATKNLRSYIDWIASCRTIISCDTLGLYLATALDKQIVALLGAEHPERVFLYGCGYKVTPIEDFVQDSSEENKAVSQLKGISVEMVLESLALLKQSTSRRSSLGLLVG
jgi:heptosyltransferase-2